MIDVPVEELLGRTNSLYGRVEPCLTVSDLYCFFSLGAVRTGLLGQPLLMDIRVRLALGIMWSDCRRLKMGHLNSRLAWSGVCVSGKPLLLFAEGSAVANYCRGSGAVDMLEVIGAVEKNGGRIGIGGLCLGLQEGSECDEAKETSLGAF